MSESGEQQQDAKFKEDNRSSQLFGRALAFILKRKGRGEQAALARKSKVGNSYISDIVSGKKLGSDKVRRHLAACLEIPYDTLVEIGRRVATYDDADESKLGVEAAVRVLLQGSPGEGRIEDSEFVCIERAVFRPDSSGNGLASHGERDDNLAFHTMFLAQISNSLGKLKFIEMPGKEMEETLMEGDTLLVDEAYKALWDGKIYVIRLREDLFIRRFVSRGEIHGFVCDNRAMAKHDLEIDPSIALLDWAVIGRVLWAYKVL